jgi:hypothetical protein
MYYYLIFQFSVYLFEMMTYYDFKKKKDLILNFIKEYDSVHMDLISH